MPQTYTCLLPFFSTKNREPIIARHSHAIVDYMGGTVRGLGGMRFSSEELRITFTYSSR